MTDVTRLLDAAAAGDRQAAADLLPLVYAELRRLAAAQLAGEKPGQTLDATALVHEAYLRLVGDRRQWDGRAHFFGAAAEAMRRILVDRARRRRSKKHGGELVRHDLSDSAAAAPDGSEEVLAVHEALGRLAEADPRAAELVKLRYFAGLPLPEVAQLLEISP